MEQGTPEWHELRRTKIGASDAPVILGISPYKTSYQLWEEKVLGKDQEQTSGMIRGTLMESQARECFEKLTGITVMPQVALSKEYEWMMASLDGITFDGTTIVEIKCPNKEVHAMAKKGEIPDHYMAQIQHQFCVTKASKGYYFSYNGEDGVLVEVFPDQPRISEIHDAEFDFYLKMLNKEPPALTDKDYVNQSGNKTWELHAQRWVDTHYALKKAELDEEVARKTMLELANGKNCMSDKIKVTRSVCRGAVDYKMVPELIGLNLEPYRKPPCEKWRLSVITKDGT